MNDGPPAFFTFPAYTDVSSTLIRGEGGSAQTFISLNKHIFIVPPDLCEASAPQRRLISVVIQHVAGVSVQLRLWYKAPAPRAILLPSAQSAPADKL